MNYIKRRMTSLVQFFRLIGIDPIKGFNFIRGLPSYIRDFTLLAKQRRGSDFFFEFGKVYPCLADKYENSGDFMGHYFHQDLLVAQRIYMVNPRVHIDIGSRIDGFVAHVAAFRKIRVFDIRPLGDIPVSNVQFSQVDMMNPLEEKYYDYCDSLSCLHALEHFGLGRYGDPVNFNGYLIGLDNIDAMLKKNGALYLSVPIGPQRIEFNAHRVFSIKFLLDYFLPRYKLNRFSYIDDSGYLYEDVELDELNILSNFDCNYGCGIFELLKR